MQHLGFRLPRTPLLGTSVNIAPQRPVLPEMLLGQMTHVSVCAWGVWCSRCKVKRVEAMKPTLRIDGRRI
jgi:ferredoxin